MNDDLLTLLIAAVGIYVVYQMGQASASPYMTPYYAPYFAPYFPVFSSRLLQFPGGGFRPPMRPEGGPEFGGGEGMEMGGGFGGTHAK